jgi:Zn-finger nucleic acid-binding protein
MSPRDYGFGSQIVIDTCEAGCGVWLDVGEVERIESFYEQSQTDAGAVLPPSFWRVRSSMRCSGKRR